MRRDGHRAQPQGAGGGTVGWSPFTQGLLLLLLIRMYSPLWLGVASPLLPVSCFLELLPEVAVSVKIHASDCYSEEAACPVLQQNTVLCALLGKAEGRGGPRGGSGQMNFL